MEITTTCQVEDCRYPAIRCNRHKCAIHSSPSVMVSSTRQTSTRIYLLVLGSLLYTNRNRNRNRQSDKAPLCRCNDERCRGIGHGVSNNDPKIRTAILGILEIEPSVRRKFLQPTVTKANVALWHFHPHHRTMRPNGTWRVNPYGPTMFSLTTITTIIPSG